MIDPEPPPDPMANEREFIRREARVQLLREILEQCTSKNFALILGEIPTGNAPWVGKIRTVLEQALLHESLLLGVHALRRGPPTPPTPPSDPTPP